MLATVPLTLLMAVALPGAFGPSGLEFAGAYLAVNLWALAIQGWSLWREPTTRRAWLRYAPLAALAPLVLLGGAFLPEARASACGARSRRSASPAPLAGGRGQEGKIEWTVDPGHFTERHALFVIISLGEILVAVGASAAGVHLTAAVGAGLLAAVAVACVFWWTYFAYVPEAVERALRSARPYERGRIARDRFTFGHFPIVFGLVLYAVAAKHVVAHPTDPASGGDLVVLDRRCRLLRRRSPGPAVAGDASAGARARHGDRRCGGAVLGRGPRVPGAVLVAVVAVIVAIMQAISLRRYDRIVAERTKSGEKPT